MKKETRKGKLGTSFLTLLLLLSTILSVQGVSVAGLIGGGSGYINIAKTTAFLAWVSEIVTSATSHFSAHFEEYVLINPDPTHPQIMRVMAFFISLSLVFYVVSITLTAFYFLFVSGSARGRAKAKYSLGKLILGMFFVSISPYLLQLLFQFSSSLTAAILDQGNISIVIDEFNVALERALESMYFMLLSESLALVDVSAGSLSNLFSMYPYFLIILLIVLVLGLLVARFLTVMMWTILFPLSIFLLSLEFTKNIGRTMMEQTMQWTLLQIFYAIMLVALSAGLVLLPAAYSGYSIFFVSFHTIVVTLMLFFGPWYLSSLLQKLFPP